MTTPSLFDPATATKLSTEDAASLVAQFGDKMKCKRDNLQIDFVPVKAPQNHTGQAFTCMHAVVLGAEDAKIGHNNTPVLKLKVLVSSVCDDKHDPVFDLVCGSYQIAVAKAKGGDAKQYPRYIPEGEVNMIPVSCFAAVSVFHSPNPKEAPLSASDFGVGTHVKLSCVTAHMKPPNVYLNAKSVVVVKSNANRFEGLDALQAVFSTSKASLMAAMTACSLLGGIENVLSQACYLGTKLYTHLDAHRTETATALKDLATKMDNKMIGEGESWATNVVNAKALSELAEKIQTSDLCTQAISAYGKPILLPLLFEAKKPHEVYPPSMQNLVVSKADTLFTTSAWISSTETMGALCKIYYNVAVGLTGKEGTAALEYGLEPLLRGEGPVGLLRRSMSDIAIALDTRSSIKAEWGATELVPFCRMVAVVPAHTREWGDRAFADGDWGEKVVIDVASGIRAAGLPVSALFCREYAGGEALIAEHVPESKYQIKPSTGPDAPLPVRLKTSG